MREIRSKDNKIWKRCEQLTMRKYRDRSGLYLIEGENLLDEAIRNHVRIETVLVREDCQKALPPEAADKAFLLDARLFDKLAQTVTSQGILAVVAKAEVRKEDFIGLPGSNFIVLDRLQDPGNIGTILLFRLMALLPLLLVKILLLPRRCPLSLFQNRDYSGIRHKPVPKV